MNKKLYIQLFVLPAMRAAALYLRFKDPDSTGADDEAAEGIEFAITRLERWIAEP